MVGLNDLDVEITSENGNVRVRSNERNVLLIDQHTDYIRKIILSNFELVFGFFLKKIDAPKDNFHRIDIERISTSIVLYYLNMYNSWRISHKKLKISLEFQEKDFDNPSTHDIIFLYNKEKYPNNWEEKSAVLIGLPIGETKEYYKRRKDFYNK
ncbi:hypothetical protein [Mucilaginibacter paludis]|uniref:Uncharacterized protein n=1 Tax=Mucilaginibacter paludis DSM 18603 TaxID=714943 RepID=H1YDY6_9SPHI|nr:hypothetical protein [Mucilaginibacter paludis]EHQ24326.1 hypothetical protein Mucpa_0123 [Mucilaginibacter paludis DSM 18603]